MKLNKRISEIHFQTLNYLIPLFFSLIYSNTSLTSLFNKVSNSLTFALLLVFKVLCIVLNVPHQYYLSLPLYGVHAGNPCFFHCVHDFFHMGKIKNTSYGSQMLHATSAILTVFIPAFFIISISSSKYSYGIYSS